MSLAFEWPRVVVFAAAFVVAFGPEFVRLVRRGSSSEATRRDAGSRTVLSVCLGAGNAVAFFLAAATGYALPAPRVAFWAGVALLVGGAAFRWYAVRVLGRFFTTDVAVSEDHAVVERGPYQWVRHPTYTGGMAAVLGTGLALANPLSLLVLAVAAVVGYAYRIRVEERVLRDELGERYGAYAERTPYRLVPYLW